jgi:hypothetical protein
MVTRLDVIDDADDAVAGLAEIVKINYPKQW